MTDFSGLGPDTGSTTTSDGPLHVDFSSEELASEGRSYDPVPTGKYYCKITNIETRYSTSLKNNGKPYWAVELTVQEGTYDKRKFWANVMLFEGALYSLVQMLKALDLGEALKTGNVPDPDDLITRDVDVSIARVVDSWKMDPKNGGDGVTKLFKNEVKGFMKHQTGSVVGIASSKGDSLLP